MKRVGTRKRTISRFWRRIKQAIRTFLIWLLPPGTKASTMSLPLMVSCCTITDRVSLSYQDAKEAYWPHPWSEESLWPPNTPATVEAYVLLSDSPDPSLGA